MSIQSEINRISSEVTTQTDLLGQIAAELAGKAAGGDIEIQTDKEAVTPSNVAQTVWPDSGYDALAKVTVKAIPSEYIIPSGTVSITKNGEHNVREAEIVNVNVASTGVDTSDATATADDIAYGKTAYVDGEKITGNVAVLDENFTIPVNNASWEDGDIVSKSALAANLLIRKGIELSYSVQGSLFGTATADDVAKGKTFTSESGLKITGIKEEASGGGLPAGIAALATDTLTPASDLTANQKITHGLGVTPNLFIVLATGRIDGPAMAGGMLYQMTSGQTWHFDTLVMTPISVHRYLDADGYMRSSSADNLEVMTQTECTIQSNSARKLRAGVTYRWIAAVVDGIE